MKLSKIFLLSILCVISHLSIAQKYLKTYEKAEEYLFNHQFDHAYKLYLQVASDNPSYLDIQYKLEISALLSANGDDHPLDQLLNFENPYANDDDHYYYWVGQVLLRRYKIDAASRAFERYEQRINYSADSQSAENEELISNAKKLKQYFDNPGNYEIHQLDDQINSSGSELSPVFISETGQLLFLSNRNNPEIDSYQIFETRKGTKGWSEISALNVFGNYTESSANIEYLNSKQQLFFNPENKKGSLLYSQYQNEKWGPVVNYQLKPGILGLTSRFILGELEDKLFFADEVPPAKLEIYETYKDPEKQKWSNAFPSRINSTYNEDCPSLSADEKTLYFSSDRPGGLGGYDIYKCDLNEDLEWSEPINLGWPINSPNDELSFKMNPDQKSGYFVSDRLHSKGGFDIYFFWEIEKVKIDGRIYDSRNHKALQNAEIKFHPQQYEDEAFSSLIDQNGRYSAQIIAGETFRVEIIQNDQVILEEWITIETTGTSAATHIQDFTIR